MSKGKYKFKTRPYTHQRDAIKKVLRQGYGGALLMEPRTGKSKTTVDLASIWAKTGEIDRVIIICPNRIIGTWVREFQTHCPSTFKITIWDKDARKLGLPPVSGLYDLEVVITNFEAFATPGKKTKSNRESKTSGRWKVRNDLFKWMNGGKTLCVVDESHKIKSPSGKASNMIVNMGPRFHKRLILTGTPVTKAKRVFDIYMQWKFLNPERFDDVPKVADFKAHYGRWQDVPVAKATADNPRPRSFPKFVGPRNLKELRTRMAQDAVIVRREDCFDLPPREDIVIPVELKGSLKTYKQMAEDMIAILEDGDVTEAQIKLVQQLRLTQITSGFVPNEFGEIKRIGFEKSDVLNDLLEDLFDKDQKVVVAARWKPDLDLIEEMGRHLGFEVYSIRGKVKRADSDANIIKFRDTPNAALMVIQPAAASMGIDLSQASTMVWYSHTNSWVDFTQACDRIALSRTSTTFYHLVATNSVDEILMDTLANDGDVAKEIMKKPRTLLTGKKLNTDGDGHIKVKTNRKTGVM
jgi:SNF2 family DNA or RNA helicase